MTEKNEYRWFIETYRTGAERKMALRQMPAGKINTIARACPNKAGQAAIAAYKCKTKRQFPEARST